MEKLFYEQEKFKLYKGNNLEVLPTLPDNSVDSIVTDPPYHLTNMNGSNKSSSGDKVFERSTKGFMGKTWDGGDIAFNVELWKQCLRVLKPGGFLLAFSGSRTYHRMAVAIEDAGFLIKDQIMWLYGSGFPKALDISKAIDKKQVQLDWFADWFKNYLKENNIPVSKIQDMFLSKTGGRTGIVSNWMNKINQPSLKQFNKLVKELKLPFNNIEELKREVIEESKRISFAFDGSKNIVDNSKTKSNSEEAKQWDGWKTALKPAHEPIVMAQKPLEKGLTYAQNILKHGVGALNIDESRIGFDENDTNPATNPLYRANNGYKKPQDNGQKTGETIKFTNSLNPVSEKGRFPANVIHDGSEEVTNNFPKNCGGSSKNISIVNEDTSKTISEGAEHHNYGNKKTGLRKGYVDSGSASRFFYGAKAQTEDRDQGLENHNDQTFHRTREDKGELTGMNNDPKWKPLERKNIHPTVKPTDLMRYLIRMVTPKNGTTLDPFFGSGSSGKGAMVENIVNNKNINIIGIELTEEYLPIARDRVIKGAKIYANNEMFGKPKKVVVDKNQLDINDLLGVDND